MIWSVSLNIVFIVNLNIFQRHFTEIIDKGSTYVFRRSVKSVNPNPPLI